MKKAKRFIDVYCSCEGRVFEPKLVLDEEDKVFLIAACEKCKTVVHLELDEMLALLYKKTLVKGNGRVN